MHAVNTGSDYTHAAVWAAAGHVFIGGDLGGILHRAP